MSSSRVWTSENAEHYDDDYRSRFSPEELGATATFLASLAGKGAALEFAIGTGRVGIALRERGVPVSGIELSDPMVQALRRKVSQEDLPVVVGDMSTTVAGDNFSLVYLVFNTISNLLTEAEQQECFANAARHLAPGGRFVVELWIPDLRRLSEVTSSVVSDLTDNHVGIDVYDVTQQRCTSHHFTRRDDSSWTHDVADFRYLLPDDCDRLADAAGLNLENRFSDWTCAPFTEASQSHISVWRKPRKVQSNTRISSESSDPDTLRGSVNAIPITGRSTVSDGGHP